MTGALFDEGMRSYFAQVGHTLAAVALGDPQAQTWAVTISEYRAELLRHVEEIPSTVQILLDAMDGGRRAAFCEWGETQMGPADWGETQTGPGS